MPWLGSLGGLLFEPWFLCRIKGTSPAPTSKQSKSLMDVTNRRRHQRRLQLRRLGWRYDEVALGSGAGGDWISVARPVAQGSRLVAV